MSKHGDYIERLKAALVGHMRKKLALQAVDGALNELLTHNPQKIPQARTLVHKAVEAGLSAPVANALNTKITAHEEAVNKVAFLETVVLRPSARAKAEAAQREALASAKSSDTAGESAARLKQFNDVAREKDSELRELGDCYAQALEAGLLMPNVNTADIFDFLTRVETIDAEDDLLRDKELAIRYVDLAQLSVDESRLEAADELLQASLLTYAKDEPGLSDLRYTVETELRRQRDATLIAKIRQRLESRSSSLTTLSDFQEAHDDIIKLAEVDSSNALLLSLQQKLEEVFEVELAAIIAADDSRTGETTLLEFARLLRLPYVTQKRALLSDAEENANFTTTVSTEHEELIREHTSQISTLLDKLLFDGAWESELSIPFKELVALLPNNDPQIDSLRQKTATLFLEKAAKSRTASRFTEAMVFVEKGLEFHPQFAGFAGEKTAIASAEATLRAQQEEERRLAKVRKLKTSLLADAQADKPQDATKKLVQLRAELPADDVFLTDEAPPQIALAYQRSSQQQAESGNFENATALAKAGIALSPTLDGLAEQLGDYHGELARMTSIRDLKQRLRSSASPYFQTVKLELAKIKAQFPQRWATLKSEYQAIVTQQLKNIETSDAASAHGYRDRAQVAFPSKGNITLRPLPSAIAARASLLEASAKDGENHADIIALRVGITERISKADAYHRKALKFKQKKQLRKAKQYLVDGAMKLWSDNPEYKKMLGQLSSTASATTSRKEECSADKAGFGSQTRGTCYDQVSGNTKGPVLVVVPASDSTQSFAIGKYEVSVAQYNLYCRASGKCASVAGDTKQPITGITVTQAQSYAGWFSPQSGATYRLPSEQGWEYAAAAGGKQPKKDFNCRVTLGDQVLKGHSLVNAKPGQQNIWGLTNYVGNAQEWVRSGGAYRARGGGYEDPLSKCDISVTRSHSDGSDGLTGFRLLRELE